MSSSNVKIEPAAEALDFDTIMRDEVGQFGWFQVRNIILALIAVMFLGSNNSYVFTAARIPTRCLIPECDLEEPQFTPDWLLNAVPGSSLDSFHNCQRYGNASAATLEEGVCLAASFDRDQLRSCEGYLYQNEDTIVYEFDLACDEWRRSLVGSIRLSGTIFAQILTGFISDRWGRRTALVFNSFNAAWMGVLRSFSNSYIVFVAAEFVSSIFSSAAFQTSHILLMELVSPTNRVFVGALTNTYASLGLMTLGLIAWAVPYWRTLIRALYIPQLFTITYIWIMSESVRWYISKGRYEDTEKALKNIARVNRKHISDRCLEVLRNKTEDVKQKQDSQKKKQEQNEPSLIKLLFQYKAVLARCFITPFLWITFTLVYHGITLNAVEISGNKYVNYIAVTAAQIPGFWISLLLLDKIGRKPVLIASYWLCAACQIVFIVLPKNQYILSLSVYMFGATCSGGILSSLYIYTTELYPTQYRHRLFAFSSMVGRFGTILAPLTPALSFLYTYHEVSGIYSASVVDNATVGCLLEHQLYILSGRNILSSLYIYTTELYPTQYRHRLFAFSSMVGRFGSILAPLTPARGTLVWAQFPFTLFAGCACVAGALVLLAPETRGARLPDTMQEAADLGKNNEQSSPT